MKSLLVTGSSGFIAPHIIKQAIAKDFKVYGIDIKDPTLPVKSCTYIKDDVRNFDLKKINNLNYVIHLAFVTNIPFTINHPVSSTNDNIVMTADLLKKATESKIKKFIFSSTASLYGNNPIPWKENMSSDPIEPYSWQKLSCEYLCQMWTKRYGTKTSIQRLFQVYGENQREDTALANFIKLRKINKPITLTETSKESDCRTGRRDFIYVGDVADAFLSNCLSSQTGSGEIINIGSGKMVSMEEIAKVIGGEIKFIPKRNFEVESHQADLTNCYKYLDWRPKENVLEWLKKFCDKELKNA